MIARAALGFLVALLVAAAARRARALSPSGAVAATLLGTLAVAAGWSWGALLIAYFAASSLMSRFGRAAKEARTSSVVAKGGERDAVQVLANGALFGGAAVAAMVHPHVRWIALGAGSLASSAADTWATEIGTLARGQPRSIVGLKPVPVGTSGAVSSIGTVAMVGGAVFVALLAMVFGWTAEVALRVAIGGVAGALVDTILGAIAQSRRWCEACACETERRVHTCGADTRAHRGFEWLDNDIVNFLSNCAGGLLAALLL